MNVRPWLRISVRALALSVLLVGSRWGPEPLTAQSATVLEAGARVRVTARAHHLDQTEGRVEDSRMLGDSLVLRVGPTGDDVVRIPWSDVWALDVSRGTRNHAVQGAVIGALGGAAVGLLIGVSQGDDPPNTGRLGFSTFSGAEKGALLGLALAAVGGAVGALIGRATHTVDWEPVYSRGRLRATAALRSSPEGIRPGLHLSWTPGRGDVHRRRAGR